MAVDAARRLAVRRADSCSDDEIDLPPGTDGDSVSAAPAWRARATSPGSRCRDRARGRRGRRAPIGTSTGPPPASKGAPDEWARETRTVTVTRHRCAVGDGAGRSRGAVHVDRDRRRRAAPPRPLGERDRGGEGRPESPLRTRRGGQRRRRRRQPRVAHPPEATSGSTKAARGSASPPGTRRAGADRSDRRRPPLRPRAPPAARSHSARWGRRELRADADRGARRQATASWNSDDYPWGGRIPRRGVRRAG